MPSYRLYHRPDVFGIGRLVGLATLECGCVVDHLTPDVIRYRDRIVRELVSHASGPFADLSVKIAVGGMALWVVPAVRGEPPPLPSKRPALTA